MVPLLAAESPEAVASAPKLMHQKSLSEQEALQQA
jgi:hypothetical protein